MSTDNDMIEIAYHERCRVAAKALGATLVGSTHGCGFSTMNPTMDVPHRVLEYIEQTRTTMTELYGVITDLESQSDKFDEILQVLLRPTDGTKRKYTITCEPVETKP